MSFVWSESNIQRARELRDAGMSKAAIARHLGVGESALRYHLDPARRESVREAERRRREAERTVRVPRERRVWNNGAKLSPDDLAARLAAIPEDTRSLTAQLMGDPIPNDPRRVWREA